MALKIRLARTGRKKVVNYRVVVAESSSPVTGRHIEVVGHYNPQAEPADFSFDTERVGYWIDRGATPSTTVGNLLKKERFEEKREALNKGLDPETAGIERRPERKRKKKKKAAE